MGGQTRNKKIDIDNRYEFAIIINAFASTIRAMPQHPTGSKEREMGGQNHRPASRIRWIHVARTAPVLFFFGAMTVCSYSSALAETQQEQHVFYLCMRYYKDLRAYIGYPLEIESAEFQRTYAPDCKKIAKHPYPPQLNPAQLADWESAYGSGQTQQPDVGADLAIEFLNGFIGGIGTHAIRHPGVVSTPRTVRPSVSVARPLPVSRAPTYVPSTGAGLTTSRSVAVVQPTKPSATVSRTTSTTAPTNRPTQGCSNLHNAIVSSSAFYQSNPGKYQADVAQYNSLCGK